MLPGPGGICLGALEWAFWSYRGPLFPPGLSEADRYRSLSVAAGADSLPLSLHTLFSLVKSYQPFLLTCVSVHCPLPLPPSLPSTQTKFFGGDCVSPCVEDACCGPWRAIPSGRILLGNRSSGADGDTFSGCLQDSSGYDRGRGRAEISRYVEW